jgi:hypothetical protein
VPRARPSPGTSGWASVPAHAFACLARSCSLAVRLLRPHRGSPRVYAAHCGSTPPQRFATPSPLVSQVATGRDRLTQLAGVGDQCCLQAQTPRAIDLLDQAVFEYRQQVALDVAMVARCRACPDLSIRTFGLCIELPPGVAIKARARSRSPRAHRPVGRRQIPSLTFASMSASSRRASDASSHRHSHTYNLGARAGSGSAAGHLH